MSEEEQIKGIRISIALVDDLKKLLHYSPDMPYNYAVDSALRELKSRLLKEAKGCKQ